MQVAALCGIVGLFLKTASLEAELGRHLAGMLTAMSDRGPDSAGFAVYGAESPDGAKLTYRAVDPDTAERLAGEHVAEGYERPVVHGTHLVLHVPAGREDAVRSRLSSVRPAVTFVGAGSRMELFKEVGRPEEVATRFGLGAMTGSHGIGHTRMATESRVTTAGAHPFSTGPDQCLVHNGSLSNHNAMRRVLRREGLDFATDNDSEVAAGYLTWRIREGATLRKALDSALVDLDGFYTFVVGTRTGFAVLRDPISCKPAVMAETPDYVAFGSEYRALAALPGITSARVFEPEPATVYAWERP